MESASNKRWFHDPFRIEARTGWVKFVAALALLSLSLGFIVESWMTIDQLLSLGSTCADASKHTHRHPPASLPLSDIGWFSVGYAIPAIAAFFLLGKATSPLATISALALALVAGLVAISFAFSATMTGMCMFVGW